MKTKNAFTLLEMMIVLLIITIILLITLPNITQKETIIREKGCKSLLSVIDSQILLYQIEKDEVPSIQDLINDGLFFFQIAIIDQILKRMKSLPFKI